MRMAGRSVCVPRGGEGPAGSPAARRGGTGVTPAALSAEDAVPQPRVRAKAPGGNRGLASASADLGRAEVGCSSTTGSSEASLGGCCGRRGVYGGVRS